MLIEDTFKLDRCYTKEFRRLLDRSFHRRAEHSIRNLVLKVSREVSHECRTETTLNQASRRSLNTTQKHSDIDKLLVGSSYHPKTTKNSTKRLIKELAAEKLNNSNFTPHISGRQEGSNNATNAPPLTNFTKAQRFLARRNIRTKQLELVRSKCPALVHQQMFQLKSNLKVSRKHFCESLSRSFSKELPCRQPVRSVPRYRSLQKQNLPQAAEELEGWTHNATEDYYQPF